MPLLQAKKWQHVFINKIMQNNIDSLSHILFKREHTWGHYNARYLLQFTVVPKYNESPHYNKPSHKKRQRKNYTECSGVDGGVYPDCHQMTAHPYPKDDRIVSEKFKFARSKQPKNPQFRGFRVAHGPGYMGLEATTWIPMGGARVPMLSLNDPQTPSQRQQKKLRKSHILKKFH